MLELLGHMDVSSRSGGVFATLKLPRCRSSSPQRFLFIVLLPKRTVDLRVLVSIGFCGGNGDLLQCKQVALTNPFKCQVFVFLFIRSTEER